MKITTHSTEQAQQTIRVWDAPTRVSHWLLASAFTVAWVTEGDSRYLDLHVFAGYVMAASLAFRVTWGFLGGPYARFRRFAYSPKAVLAYLKGVRNGEATRFAGHNPAGSWAVFLLLGLSASVSLSGLFVLSGEEQHGPLAGWLSFNTGDWAHRTHDLLATTLLWLVGVHLTGVVFESVFHRENLVAAMVSGYKKGFPATPSSPRFTAIAGLLVGALLLATPAYFWGWLTRSPNHPYQPFPGPVLASNPTWTAECEGCHLAYHPNLLPARSWRRMLDNQANHFGEDLFLSPETVSRLKDFATQHAAERHATETAWQIARTTPPDQAPLRVTKTSYWRRQHQGLSKTLWQRDPIRSKTNCGACHRDANAGTFQDSAMGIPSAETPMEADTGPLEKLKARFSNAGDPS